MTTRRLFYEDPYRKVFQAQVQRIEPVSGGYRIILDQTLFYPESGGQPADRGFLDDIPVLDVQEEDSEIVHLLKDPPVHTMVIGTLDWPRRFDHMQHHSGQHILSQSLLQISGAETVSFHLSSQSASIDLNMLITDENTLRETEEMANQIIYDDLAIETLLLTPKEAKKLPWRAALPAELTEIRGIRMGEFDLCGCGGTHVQSTGEIGMIKIVKVGPYRNGTRVDFACGKRALADYSQKNKQILCLAQMMGSPEQDLVEMVEQLQHNHQELQKEIKCVYRNFDQQTADHLWEQGASTSHGKMIVHSFTDMSIDRLKEMASFLAEKNDTIALLGTQIPKPAVVFARSSEGSISMSALLQEALANYGGKGGGQKHFAQGGGVDPASIPCILKQALITFTELK